MSPANNQGIQARSLWFICTELLLPLAKAPTTTLLSHKFTILHPPLSESTLSTISLLSISSSNRLMCFFFTKEHDSVSTHWCFIRVSTKDCGVLTISVGGSMAWVSQSNRVYSPRFSPNWYKVFEKAPVVKVAALPPATLLASVADTWVETGQRALLLARGKSKTAVINSSFTCCGILTLWPSGVLSINLYTWLKIDMHSRRCMKGCTNSPTSFCMAFFVTRPPWRSAQVSISICLSLLVGALTKPDWESTCVPQALKVYCLSNAFLVERGSWSLWYLSRLKCIKRSSPSSPRFLKNFLSTIWKTRWSSM